MRPRPWPTRAEQVRAAFNARFWYAEGGYLYDVVDGENGDDTACRPNQLLAISLAHPVLDPARWASVLDGGPRAPGHAGGPPDPRAGPPGLQGDVRRRPPGPRRRLSSGHGLALADRPLRRRVAPCLPRGPAERPAAPGRLRVASRRGLRRQHQRDLRRRGPVHAPRVHLPGLERGRGAPRPHPHGRAGLARIAPPRRQGGPS